MKFQNTIRRAVIFAGFAAGFALLPGAVNAQEITNTEFSDGPYVTAIAEPAAPAQTTASNPAVVPSQVMLTNAATAAAGQAEQAAAQAPEPNAIVTFLLVFCSGLIALYALITADRTARKMATAQRSYVIPRSA